LTLKQARRNAAALQVFKPSVFEPARQVAGTLEAHSPDWSPLEAKIEELKDGYVMHAQHVTHGQVTGQAVKEDDRPAIELF